MISQVFHVLRPRPWTSSPAFVGSYGAVKMWNAAGGVDVGTPGTEGGCEFGTIGAGFLVGRMSEASSRHGGV